MLQHFGYDDLAPGIPKQFRGIIDNNLKIDGRLRVYKGEGGFLYSTSPNGALGMALFMKGHLPIHVIVPMNLVRLGSAFRTLADKAADTLPVVPAPPTPAHVPGANNRLDATIRTLWTTLATSMATLRQLEMLEADLAFCFNDLHNNVDSITNAFPGDVRRVLQSGGFSLRDLTSLRHVSDSFPGQGTSCTEDVSPEIVTMAEQTMILLMDSYLRFLFKPRQDSASLIASSNQAKYLSSVMTTTAAATAWPRIRTKGCNFASPLFDFKKSSDIIAVRTVPGDPSDRTFTSYRMKRSVLYYAFRDGSFSARIGFGVDVIRQSGTALKEFVIVAKDEQMIAQRPRHVYLVYEIMDDRRPHPRPWIGVPSLESLYGDREPHVKIGRRIAKYPTGPYRFLTYHRSMNPEELDESRPVQVPFEERLGLWVEDQEIEDEIDDDQLVASDEED
ncbi:hypothetical protein HYE67_002437 [Fusarium culmorum]|uniref:Uncharacterized protein n=1 Tax=Fusarium culmorum TaxID=5516 RepID=A0A7S8HSR8_FUSCU|nr:hypothetical protein HYE67_002437 [Fusarium culmorum]